MGMSNGLHPPSSHENIPHSLTSIEVKFLEDFVRNGNSRFNIIELLMVMYPEEGRIHYSGGKYYSMNKLLSPMKQQLFTERSELFKKKIIELMHQNGYEQGKVGRASSDTVLYFHSKHYRGENDGYHDSTNATQKILLKFMKIFGK